MLKTIYKASFEEDGLIEECGDYRRFDVFELLESGDLSSPLHEGVTLDVIQEQYDISCEHLQREMEDQIGDIHVSVWDVGVLVLREV